MSRLIEGVVCVGKPLMVGGLGVITASAMGTIRRTRPAQKARRNIGELNSVRGRISILRLLRDADFSGPVLGEAASGTQPWTTVQEKQRITKSLTTAIDSGVT